MSNPVTPAQLRQISLWALWALMAIVVTGAAVRLTGSGLGCSDWPTCESGQLVPDRGGLHAAIEFGNRLFSVVPAMAVVAALVAARRLSPSRPNLRWWAWGMVAGVAAQILVGAVVVWTDLLPSAVITHFLLSMVTIWNAVILHNLASREPGKAVARAPEAVIWVSRALVALGIYVLVTGTIVTGTGPHSGDAADPERLPYFLPDVARLHSSGVIVTCAIVVGLVIWSRRGASDAIARAALLLLTAVVVQGAIGYIQYAADVPVLLVGLHILGSMAFWVALLRFHLCLFAVPAGASGDWDVSG